MARGNWGLFCLALIILFITALASVENDGDIKPENYGDMVRRYEKEAKIKKREEHDKEKEELDLDSLIARALFKIKYGKDISGSKDKRGGVPKNCLEDDDPAGINYKGTESKTVDGLPCRPWTELDTSDLGDMGGGETPEAAQNYCRNPPSRRRDRPWCYAHQASRYGWEYCDICSCTSKVSEAAKAKKCIDPDDPKGQRYRGPQRITIQGHTCQPWKDFLDDECHAEAPNLCRNPGGGEYHTYCPDPGAWRYGRGQCDVPRCDKIFFIKHKQSEKVLDVCLGPCCDEGKETFLFKNLHGDNQKWYWGAEQDEGIEFRTIKNVEFYDKVLTFPYRAYVASGTEGEREYFRVEMEKYTMDPHNNCHQLWKKDEEKMVIRNKCDENLVLDLFMNNDKDGTRIGCWPENELPAQKWTMEFAGDPN